MTFILGLTGGIATGKSTVANVFKAAGVPLVDADLVARKVVEPGEAGLKAVTDYFGDTILLPDGRLDRQQLGRRVFASQQERQQLNQLLAPFIRQEIDRQINAASQGGGLVVVDIPLLFEEGYERVMDQVAVVYVTPQQQLARLMARDGFSEEEARKRIASQWPMEKKRQLADIIFDNSGTQEQTVKQVQAWLAKQTF